MRTVGGSITISAKNVFTAASRVSGRVWSLVRITIPNGLKYVKIGVEKPQNNSLYPYFQREPLDFSCVGLLAGTWRKRIDFKHFLSRKTGVQLFGSSDRLYSRFFFLIKLFEQGYKLYLS